MKKFAFIAIVVLAVAGLFYVFPKKDITITPEQREALQNLNFNRYVQTNYSFATDTDHDGLSDAKEIIYGTDPNKADTDGDGFSDGQEVQAGYDPLVPGKARLTDRKQLSLSIQYFSWLQAQTSNPNPPLEAKSIGEFLAQKKLLTFELPPVLEYDIHFTNDDPTKLENYLTLTSSLTLPEEGSPYLAFAGQLVKQNSFNGLTTVLDALNAQLAQLKKAQVPAFMTQLHRRYVGIWQELTSIFADLKHAQDDPVLIYRDEKKGEWLVEQVKNTEVLRANLIADLKLKLFQENAQTAPQSQNNSAR